MTTTFVMPCDQPQLPLPPPTKFDAEDESTSDESSGPTDDEGGLTDDDDDVFAAPRSATTTENGRHPSPTSGSPEMDAGLISLMEKLVRSHSVWYLPHVGRSAAAHLLRGKQQGTFIVRQSSKNSAMALSVRLPMESGQIDIDHYLIETTPMGVKLEGSPNYFPALPILLEYYCLHGEELQTKLTLPAAIMQCESRRDMQSFALLGQDFWTSELSDPARSISRASNKQQSSTKAQEISAGHQRMTSRASPCYDTQEIKIQSGPPAPLLAPSDFAQLSPAVPQETQQIESAPPSSACICTPNDVPMENLVQSAVVRKTRSAHEKLSVGPKPALPVKPVKKLSLDCPSLEKRSESISEGTAATRGRPDPLRGEQGGGVGKNRDGERKSFRLKNWFKKEEKQKEEQERKAFLRESVVPGFSGRSGVVTSQSVSSLLQEQNEAAKLWNTPTPGRRRLQTFKPESQEPEREAEVVNTALPAPAHSGKVRPAPPPPLKPKPGMLRREKSDLGWVPTGGQQHRPGTADRNDTPRPGTLRATKGPSPPQSSVEELRQNRLVAVMKQKANCQQEVIARKDGSPHVVRKGTSGSAGVTMRQKPTPPSRLHLENINAPARTVAGRKIEHRLSAPNLAEMAAGKSIMNGGNYNDNTGCQKFGRQPTGELHTINEGLVTPVVRRKAMNFEKTPPQPREERQAPIASAELVTSTSSSNGSTENETNRRFSQSLEDLLSAVGVCAGGKRPPLEKKEEKKTKTLPNASGKEQAKNGAPNGSGGKLGGFQRKFGSERSPGKKMEQLENQRGGSCRVNGFNSTTLPTRNKQQQEENEIRSDANFQWVQVTNEIKSRQKVAKVRPRLDPARRSSESTQTASTTTTAKTLSGGSTTGSSDFQHNNRRTMSTRSGESNYAQLSEFSEFLAPSEQICIEGQSHADEDAVSTAGTVFNEPWDSSVWENLLDLAHYGDVSKTPASVSRSYLPQSQGSRVVKRQMERKDDQVEGEESEYGSRYGSVTAATVERRNIARKRARDGEVKEGQWKENNLPTTSAAAVDPWEEFSSRIPQSSESSSSPSTWGSRKSKERAAKIEDRYFALRGHQKPEERTSTESEDDRFALGPVTTPPRLKEEQNIQADKGGTSRKELRRVQDPGKKIQEYIEKLAEDRRTMFGGTLQQFIQCTVEGGETDPGIVIKNVRQFMNGIKNYLVKHGEGHLHELIERERAKLTSTEFLNIDAILEGVFHKIVLGPLKPHLYHLMIKEHSKNGALQALSENLAKVRGMSPTELGLKDVEVPGPDTMETIRTCLRKMQHHYSPLKKLENLLKAVSLAHGESKKMEEKSDEKGRGLPAADDLVRWLVFLLSRCSVVGCEVEGTYMWELLPQQLLTGEASYYLTALFSAVHVLKQPDSLPKLAQKSEDNAASTLLGMEVGSTVNGSMMSLASSNSGPDGFVRVAIPDEAGGSIQYHTFPAVPQMTTGKLCRMIAHKNGITNPEDYGLYLLVDGFETCLLVSECPDLIRDQLRAANKPHMFAYKRHEAKIAWPKVAMTPRL